MRSDILNNNSNNSEFNANTAGVKVKSQIVEFTAESDSIKGSVTLPLNSIVLNIHCVVETALVYASATLGCRCGTASEGAEFMALDADGLVGTTTTLAAGKGLSTNDVYRTALGGAATSPFVANSPYATAGTEVHFETKASTGAFTAGKMCYVVEYIELTDRD